MKLETSDISSCNLCGDMEQIEVGKSPDFEYHTCHNEFVFVECGNCGHIYLKYRQIPETLDIIYPSSCIPHKFDEHLGQIITKLRQIVQKQKINPWQNI
ncbi:MAG: hypothetical protein AAF478_09325 [Pseudomonadota bacterium]